MSKPTYEELAAQVEVLKQAYRNLCGAINDADDTETGSDEHDDAIGKIFSVMRDGYQAANQSPASCLAQVRAESEQNGFVAGWKRRSALGPLRKMWSEDEILEIAREHANRIRQEGDV